MYLGFVSVSLNETLFTNTFLRGTSIQDLGFKLRGAAVKCLWHEARGVKVRFKFVLEPVRLIIPVRLREVTVPIPGV